MRKMMLDIQSEKEKKNKDDEEKKKGEQDKQRALTERGQKQVKDRIKN